MLTIKDNLAKIDDEFNNGSGKSFTDGINHFDAMNPDFRSNYGLRTDHPKYNEVYKFRNFCYDFMNNFYISKIKHFNDTDESLINIKEDLVTICSYQNQLFDKFLDKCVHHNITKHKIKQLFKLMNKTINLIEEYLDEQESLL